VKCKLATPKTLWTKFEEMPPIFVNREVLEAAVPKEMFDYLTRTGRKRTTSKKLLCALEADEIMLYTLLLRWYIEHGLELQAVYTTIEYQPGKFLAWFVDEVTDARRMGDTDKQKAIFAEVFKLLGNSSYGKIIEALERHTNVSYTKDEKLWTVHYVQPGLKTLQKYPMHTKSQVVSHALRYTGPFKLVLPSAS